MQLPAPPEARVPRELAMTQAVAEGAERRCGACGGAYSALALSCPSCGALTHRERLEQLADTLRSARQAESLERQEDCLREMLDLLPRGSNQREAVARELAPLQERRRRTRRGRAAGLGGLALLLWKFKAVALFLLGKGKLLLMGLTKAKTFFSMVLALGAYWSIWGWQFALGFILSIYVHEMGHVAALRSLGISASAPMFVPFLGAFVRLHEYPRSPREDAVVGLAGPIYGAAAAIGCFLVYRLSSIELFGALARAGAIINLFNLIPIWQLDGGRGFNALARRERWGAVALLLAGYFITGDGLLLLLTLGAGYRAVATQAPELSDLRAAVSFAGLVVTLCALTLVELPSMQSG